MWLPEPKQPFGSFISRRHGSSVGMVLFLMYFVTITTPGKSNVHAAISEGHDASIHPAVLTRQLKRADVRLGKYPLTDYNGTHRFEIMERRRSQLAALQRSRVDPGRKTSQISMEKDARDHVESALSEVQSQVAVLRMQNEKLNFEKKKDTQDLTLAKNECSLLVSEKLELEHDLATSQFRENEATIFLRQFRKFYCRLLRNKAAQGTGEACDIISEIPGAPSLDDMIDIDVMLYESGLIEGEEMMDDTTMETMHLRPSGEAILCSAAAAAEYDVSVAVTNHNTASDGSGESIDIVVAFTLMELKEPQDNDDDTKKADDDDFENNENDENNVSARILKNSIIRSSYSGRIIPAKEKELTLDLRKMTERCISLQIALNQEKANVNVLTSRSGSLSNKRLAQEAIALRQALDRKTHDLQAIIWKMNELQLINKMYNNKIVNRDQNVHYLEESLMDLQRTNRVLVIAQ